MAISLRSEKLAVGSWRSNQPWEGVFLLRQQGSSFWPPKKDMLFLAVVATQISYMFTLTWGDDPI